MGPRNVRMSLRFLAAVKAPWTDLNVLHATFSQMSPSHAIFVKLITSRSKLSILELDRRAREAEESLKDVSFSQEV